MGLKNIIEVRISWFVHVWAVVMKTGRLGRATRREAENACRVFGEDISCKKGRFEDRIGR